MFKPDKHDPRVPKTGSHYGNMNRINDMGIKREPFKGRVKIGPFSSFRKLARALRRGKLPPEHLGMIKRAMESASRRMTSALSPDPKGE